MNASRLVPANDLVTVQDIAERTGLHQLTVVNYSGRMSGTRARPGFPRPVVGRGHRGIWLWPEVEKWWHQARPYLVETLRDDECKSRTRDPYPTFRSKTRRVA